MLELQVRGTGFIIDLDWGAAPKTAAALLGLLPLHLDLHAAKVAGEQILMPVPLVMDFEAERDVLHSPPGTVIYYPKRQFLEILLGPVLEQSANATYLGAVRGDLEPLHQLCAALQRSHGHETMWAVLSAPAGPGNDQPPSKQEGKAAGMRKAVWTAMPADIARLARQQGPMMPLGPLFYAESETRKLHEFLWAFRECEDTRFAATGGSVLVRSAGIQLRDFFGLNETAAMLLELAELLAQWPERPLLDEVILTVGRISHWLDLLLPWQDLNHVMVQPRKLKNNQPLTGPPRLGSAG